MKIFKTRRQGQEGTLRAGTPIWDELARMDTMRAQRERDGEINFNFVAGANGKRTAQSRFGNTPDSAVDMGWEGR